MLFKRWTLAGLAAVAAASPAYALEPMGCESVFAQPVAQAPASTPAPASAPTPASKPSPRDTHERLTGVLWFQTAAEYRVDSLVKYRQATAALDQALADPGWTAAIEQTASPLPRQTAVIMDLDETVIDNSRLQGELVRRRSAYDPALWSSWVGKACAGSVPGALEFVRSAEAKGVTVFFVTNRSAAEEANTRINLQKLGIRLPTDIDTVLTSGEMPGWTSDKTTRRAYIAANYRILLLVGDDLGDFVSGAKAPPADRSKLAEKYLASWGTRWFLINNPLYGSWEAATYGSDFSKPDEAVLNEKNALVRGFNP